MNKGNIKFYLIFLLAIILGVAVDYLFYGKPVGVSFFVFIFVFTAFLFILTNFFNRKFKKFQLLLLLLMFFFSAMVFLRADGVLIFFNILVSLFLLALIAILFLDKKLLDFKISNYFAFPFSFIKNSVKNGKVFIKTHADFRGLEQKYSSQFVSSILKGIIIALPLLIFFTFLLVSADLVFQRYIGELFRIDIDIIKIIQRLLIILITSYFFIGLFAYTLVKPKLSNSSNLEVKENKTNSFLDSIESLTILILVNLLFLVFIIIQFFYLFGGEKNIRDLGFTYAEYAKRGFFELIAVSIISFILIYGLAQITHRKTRLQNTLFKILSSIFIFGVMVIMASALKRLVLYTAAYGFTELRLYSYIFIIWLFLVFLFFSCKILLEKRESYFIFSVFLLALLFWIGTNFLNPEAFIARENIERYAQGKQLDTWHLSTLSEDALPEIVKIFELRNREDKIKSEVACHLNRQKEYLSKSLKVQSWQSFNLSKQRALEILQKHSPEIEKYKEKYLQILKTKYPEFYELYKENGEFPPCFPLKNL